MFISQSSSRAWQIHTISLFQILYLFWGCSVKIFCFAVMSEDMVKDGYVEIVNVDISSVAIDMMRRKYEHIPELQCIVTNELQLFKYILISVLAKTNIFVVNFFYGTQQICKWMLGIWVSSRMNHLVVSLTKARFILYALSKKFLFQFSFVF